MDTNGASEAKRPGRRPLDLPRVCSVCGADVVRPGVLRPEPLCAKHYFERRRRAQGAKPRGTPRLTVKDAVAMLVDCRNAFSSLVAHYTESDGEMQPAAERLHALALRCEATITGLAAGHPSVRGSTKKQGADNAERRREPT